jgi:hypothetical protein
MKHYFKILILLAIVSSCNQPTIEKVTLEKHIAVKVFKQAPIGVHEYLSPKYYAILENGDTVPVSAKIQIGDTISYKYIKYDRASN